MDGSSWPVLQLPPNISQLVQRYGGQLKEGLEGTDEGCARTVAVDLSVGEFPCNETFGPPRCAVEVVARKLSEGKSNGYMQSHGCDPAKEAIANKFSPPGHPLTSKQAVLTLGIREAINLSISVLCDPGDNILVPGPGSPYYTKSAVAIGVETREYRLKPDCGWEVDLPHLKSLIDDRTMAIVLSNPSFPTGTVYSEGHLKELLAVAEHHLVPVISDESFRHVPFTGQRPLQLAALSDQVPILECGGFDTYLQAVGWKLGWILLHDRHGALEKEVRSALENLTMRVLGPVSLVQVAIPEILQMDLSSYQEKTAALLKANTEYFHSELSGVVGLQPVLSQAGLSMVVKVDFSLYPGSLGSDVQFVEKLLLEEKIKCAAGSKECGLPGYILMGLAVSAEDARKAVQGIKTFCSKYCL